MKTLDQLLEERTTKSTRMGELNALRQKEDNRRFTAEEAGEFDGLDADVQDLDDEIRIKDGSLGRIVEFYQDWRSEIEEML